MTTMRCSTIADPKKRPEPRRISTVLMQGNWAFHAYKRSHDGLANAIYEPFGYRFIFGRKSVRLKVMSPRNDRAFYWHPDNRRCAYWALDDRRKVVAVLDVRKISKDMEGGPPPHEVLYTPEPGHSPYGLEWSPSGKSMYVVERFLDDEGALYSRIVRADLNKMGKPPVQIARMGGLIDFFMPPVSRFENGDGPSKKRYWIVFGHPRGLFLVDPSGGRVREVANLPAVGLHNIEWNPKKNQFVLFFKRASIGATGDIYKGVYIVHLDRIGRDPNYMEHVYDKLDVHTLWYSPKGKYVAWATPDKITFREPEGGEEHEIVALDNEIELEIKGVTWHHSEKKLAYTAGNKVLVYDVKTKESLQVASFGKDTTHFTAEPVWVGDDVYLTVFQDLSRDQPKRSSKPILERKGEKKPSKRRNKR